MHEMKKNKAATPYNLSCDISNISCLILTKRGQMVHFDSKVWSTVLKGQTYFKPSNTIIITLIWQTTAGYLKFILKA